MRTLHVNASAEYDVLIGGGLIDRAGELTARALEGAMPRRCAVVTDGAVDALYGGRVLASFERAGFEASKLAFPAGEASKNLGTLSDVLEHLAERRMTRADLVVALGGGVVGDTAGFAAAVYARGVRFIQIPTTLLSAVDASVGGKTAVDLKGGKNLAGAFHQPSLVVADADVLRALPPELMACGAAEAVKMGVLFDEALFAQLEDGSWHDRMEDVVGRCVALKRDVVAEDEFDTGARALLNLGHTFAHAIEQCSGLSVGHGRAVAVGMLMAANAAGCDAAVVRRLAACLRRNGLPTHCDYSAPVLVAAALADKKRSGDGIALVLPEAIGRCRLHWTPVTELRFFFDRALEAQEALGL